jgi:hypothetical protein
LSKSISSKVSGDSVIKNRYTTAKPGQIYLIADGLLSGNDPFITDKLYLTFITDRLYLCFITIQL